MRACTPTQRKNWHNAVLFRDKYEVRINRKTALRFVLRSSRGSWPRAVSDEDGLEPMPLALPDVDLFLHSRRLPQPFSRISSRL
ncbi:hypothetical protein scyTo_0012400 [Scyliorhinus torazame]|uniref:Uncharacterized protein n=1 Tax=Scyliorhinus torazame TaxID=75743 RepID=A0A401P876_SCYTO|nr:hypothetical protein [Scyliorhinus torazame]